jgi:biotin synthase-like enzyme
MEKYLKTNLFFQGGIMHFASRGCPYSCSFCSNSALGNSSPGRYYRLRSPQNVIQEIKRNRQKYWQQGFRVVLFMDETFGLNMKQLEGFCDLYIKEGLNKQLPWMCFSRANIVTERWARLVAAAGCIKVALGIESGSDSLRTQTYKKSIVHSQIISSARYIRDNNFLFSFSIMIGCPDETRQTIKNSRKLVKEIKPYKTAYNFYQPLPRTELAEKAKGAVIGKDIKPLRFSNLPRLSAKALSIEGLNMIMWSIRIKEASRFLGQGLRLKGVIFILDVIRYIFSINGSRPIPLLNPNTFTYLREKTLHRYIFEKKGVRIS